MVHYMLQQVLIKNLGQEMAFGIQQTMVQLGLLSQEQLVVLKLYQVMLTTMFGWQLVQVSKNGKLETLL